MPQTGPFGYTLSLLVFGFVHPLAKGLAYRGFLLNHLERLLASTMPGALASFILASILFGLASANQGWAAVLVTTLTGAVFNALYYWAHRNVWPSILANAVYNAAALVLLNL